MVRASRFELQHCLAPLADLKSASSLRSVMTEGRGFVGGRPTYHLRLFFFLNCFARSYVPFTLFLFSVVPFVMCVCAASLPWRKGNTWLDATERASHEGPTERARPVRRPPALPSSSPLSPTPSVHVLLSVGRRPVCLCCPTDRPGSLALPGRMEGERAVGCLFLASSSKCVCLSVWLLTSHPHEP
jgi:hypothetical protein